MNALHKSLLAVAAGLLALAPLGAVQAAAPAHATYAAHLYPLNTKVAKTATTGEARFTINGERLTIDIRVHGAPPDMVHWQHFHGFADGQQAVCPAIGSDKNGDGIIDLIETGQVAGTTMVPFITQPASMDVAHGSYPKADARGNYHYHETVSLPALEQAFAKAFPGQQLDLNKRVVFIHGVPAGTALPASVQSLGPIPAQVTLPIACGQIERVGVR